VRCHYFQFQASRDAAAGVVAQNDVIHLCHLPAGARLLGGKLKFGVFGASVTADVGLAGADGSGYITVAATTADDPDAIATLLTTPAAGGMVDMFEEPAYLFYETEKELELTITLGGANPADNVELSGFIMWVLD
jgi:hypothetical protein